MYVLEMQSTGESLRRFYSWSQVVDIVDISVML